MKIFKAYKSYIAHKNINHILNNSQNGTITPGRADKVNVIPVWSSQSLYAPGKGSGLLIVG